MPVTLSFHPVMLPRIYLVRIMLDLLQDLLPRIYLVRTMLDLLQDHVGFYGTAHEMPKDFFFVKRLQAHGNLKARSI